MANNATKNPMKVITGPDTRWSYANIWEPKSINGGTPKYSVSLIIPKADTRTVEKVKTAIVAAYAEGQAKLKGSSRSVPPLSSIKTPLRDGDVERRTTRPTPTPTSSTQTPPPHPASSTPTSTRCSADPRSTRASTVARASTSTLSTPTATVASPAA